MSASTGHHGTFAVVGSESSGVQLLHINRAVCRTLLHSYQRESNLFWQCVTADCMFCFYSVKLSLITGCSLSAGSPSAALSGHSARLQSEAAALCWHYYTGQPGESWLDLLLIPPSSLPVYLSSPRPAGRLLWEETALWHQEPRRQPDKPGVAGQSVGLVHLLPAPSHCITTAVSVWPVGVGRWS